MGRNDHGQFTASHDADPDAVLAAMNRGEPYTTGELAERVDAPRRTVLEYLSELHDRGDVERKDRGSRLSVWWCPE